MDSFFVRINEENKLSLNKPHQTNRVYYSELKEWFTKNAFRSFSMKYVLDGTIVYRTGAQVFEVEGGSFLLADKQEDVKAYFESDNITKSICIDINSEIIAEAATIMSSKNDFQFDDYLNKHFDNTVICEQVYPSKGTLLGNKLIDLAGMIKSGNQEQLNKEWFLEIAEIIILQEKGNYVALNGLKSVKSATRKETLRRLNKAKLYMDNFFLQNLEISEIANYCNMSEFHFFRSFKQAFKTTPYKYLLRKRLEFSKELLRDKFPAKEIAANCGFADVFTFSKAFKRTYGIPPTTYQKQ